VACILYYCSYSWYKLEKTSIWSSSYFNILKIIIYVTIFKAEKAIKFFLGYKSLVQMRSNSLRRPSIVQGAGARVHLGVYPCGRPSLPSLAEWAQIFMRELGRQSIKRAVCEWWCVSKAAFTFREWRRRGSKIWSVCLLYASPLLLLPAMPRAVVDITRVAQPARRVCRCN